MIVQADIGSTQHVSSPKYLIFPYQTQNRKGVPVKKLMLLYLMNLILVNTMLKSMANDILEIV